MSLSGTNMYLVDSLDAAMSFKRWLGERHENNVVAIDTETTGLDPRDAGAKIRLIQFGDTMTGWSLPWEDWRGLAMEALTQWDGQWAFWNVAFEMKWLHEHAPNGYRVPRDRSVDGMIAAHIINPLGSGALKQNAAKHIDRAATAGQNALSEAMSQHGWTWATVPIDFEPYWAYASLDTVLTARLWDKFQHDVGPGQRYADVFDLEMAVRFIVSRMEEHGARVDVEYAGKQRRSLETDAEAVEKWAKAVFGINIGSNDQLGAKLIELGGELFDKTTTGKPKVDKYTLKVLMDPENGYPEAVQVLAEQALRARRARKFASAYFRNFVEKSYDGVIHADIRTLGARTARMSVGNPALQQIPKNNALVRRAFVPRDGNVLVTADYDQIEARIFAEMSEDPGLVEAFRTADSTGGDFFVELGKQIYAEPDFKKSDKRRTLIKNVQYGRMYGAGVAKMAESAGVPVSRMQIVADSMDKRFPGMATFMKKIESEGWERQKSEGQGYVVTPLGRRLPADENRLYALTNYCLAPDTPILTSELKHMPAASISVGDRLVAFDEEPTTNEQRTKNGGKYAIRRWRTAVVEAVSLVVKPTLRITFSDGRTVECSNDHLWLYHHDKKTQPRTRWIRADELVPGHVLHSTGKPWDIDTTRDGGWLAGMYDGEGYLGSRNSGHATTVLQFSQLAGPVMTKFYQTMNAKNLPYTYQHASPNSTSPTDSCGTTSIPGIMRVLGTLQPERFKSRFESIYEGGALVGGSTAPLSVVSVEDVGLRELSSIQTSTRTLIANGILSHNCIQSTAADVLKSALIRLDAAGYDSFMILPVHDEIVLDIPKEYAEQALRDVPLLMQETDHAVPLTASADGALVDWGQKYL